MSGIVTINLTLLIQLVRILTLRQDTTHQSLQFITNENSCERRKPEVLNQKGGLYTIKLLLSKVILQIWSPRHINPSITIVQVDQDSLQDGRRI